MDWLNQIAEVSSVLKAKDFRLLLFSPSVAQDSSSEACFPLCSPSYMAAPCFQKGSCSMAIFVPEPVVQVTFLQGHVSQGVSRNAFLSHWSCCSFGRRAAYRTVPW